jgi:hypothetical protein
MRKARIKAVQERPIPVHDGEHNDAICVDR